MSLDPRLMTGKVKERGVNTTGIKDFVFSLV